MKEGTDQVETNDDVLKVLGLIFLALLTIGTLGFMILRGDSLWDAFYLTIIILLTHFYHEIKEPLLLQILILSLIIGSFIIVAYVIKFLAEYFFEGTFKEKRRRRNMEKTIHSISDHFIICGYGRMGKQIVEELVEEKMKFIIVERDPIRAKTVADMGYLVVHGDPTEEESLLKAGILKAKALITAIGASYVDNLYVVLSARSLRPDIFILARARKEEDMMKLKKAGANKVTIPEQIAGYHMATMALRPAVVDFLDVITDSKHDELQVEEFQIVPGAVYVNRPLTFFIDQIDNGVVVLAINRVDGTTRVSPGGSEILSINDKLILMGNRKELEKITDKVPV